MADREKLIELLNEASEALLETIGSFNDNHGNGMRADYLIANDVAPVRHGRWEPVSDDDQDEGQFHCSACGAPDFFPNGVPLSKYCYNCGAKMD